MIMLDHWLPVHRLQLSRISTFCVNHIHCNCQTWIQVIFCLGDNESWKKGAGGGRGPTKMCRRLCMSGYTRHQDIFILQESKHVIVIWVLALYAMVIWSKCHTGVLYFLEIYSQNKNVFSLEASWYITINGALHIREKSERRKYLLYYNNAMFMTQLTQRQREMSQW